MASASDEKLPNWMLQEVESKSIWNIPASAADTGRSGQHNAQGSKSYWMCWRWLFGNEMPVSLRRHTLASASEEKLSSWMRRVASTCFSSACRERETRGYEALDMPAGIH